MVIGETTVRPMDGAVEHPGRDLLRVGERIPWHAYKSVPVYTKFPTVLSHSVVLYFALFQRTFIPKRVGYLLQTDRLR